MEEKIPTVSFCGFCYRSPASCNSNVANTRNCMKKLACFSEAFCKLYFLEQVMSCNNRKEKKKKILENNMQIKECAPFLYIFTRLLLSSTRNTKTSFL